MHYSYPGACRYLSGDISRSHIYKRSSRKHSRLIAALAVVGLHVSAFGGLGPIHAADKPASLYQCSFQFEGQDTVLSFEGDRANSEHLRVNGAWESQVTGLDNYRVVGRQTAELEIRLRGNGYGDPNGYQSISCSAYKPVSQYQCSYRFDGRDTLLNLGGKRANSEHLRINNEWVSEVTGLDEYRIPDQQPSGIEIRLWGNGYSGQNGYQSAWCAADELAPLEPESGVLFGAWPKSQATGRFSSETAVAEFEALTGSRVEIVQTFNPPHKPNFNTSWANWVLESGRIPLITWKIGPGAWPDEGDNIAQRVVNGEYDSQIRQRAAEAKLIDGQWFSRLFHEMDGQYGKRYDMTPTLFHAYWKRVQRIFAEEGVTNAVWVWTPAALQPGEEVWYPGDAYVDWIGVDPYLWIGENGENARKGCVTNTYQTLEQRIGTTFWNFAKQHPSKPIMLAEWGVGHRANTDIKQRFIASASDAIAKYPKLKALVYFNSSPPAGCGWTFNSSTPQALTAYKNLTARN